VGFDFDSRTLEMLFRACVRVTGFLNRRTGSTNACRKRVARGLVPRFRRSGRFGDHSGRDPFDRPELLPKRGNGFHEVLTPAL
jgi:hypothetical protein